MCKHEWQRLCKVPNQGICPFCDICKHCGIHPIDIVQEEK